MLLGVVSFFTDSSIYGFCPSCGSAIDCGDMCVVEKCCVVCGACVRFVEAPSGVASVSAPISEDDAGFVDPT